MTRRKLIVGNWKMNGRVSDLEEVRKISEAALRNPELEVGLCLPSTLIQPAAASGSAIWIGAQDCHPGISGAYTGCISAAMLKDAGAQAIIVGHSERRRDFAEGNEAVRAKAEAVVREGLTAIICVGEPHDQRVSGRAVAYVTDQLRECLPRSLGGGDLIVAYEPVWAIGSGTSATCSEIAESHEAIREVLLTRYGHAGGVFRLLYGGSCGPTNCKEITSVENVDGMLVGGASLRSETLANMMAELSNAEVPLPTGESSGTSEVSTRAVAP